MLQRLGWATTNTDHDTARNAENRDEHQRISILLCYSRVGISIYSSVTSVTLEMNLPERLNGLTVARKVPVRHKGLLLKSDSFVLLSSQYFNFMI